MLAGQHKKQKSLWFYVNAALQQLKPTVFYYHYFNQKSETQHRVRLYKEN